MALSYICWNYVFILYRLENIYMNGHGLIWICCGPTQYVGLYNIFYNILELAILEKVPSPNYRGILTLSQSHKQEREDMWWKLKKHNVKTHQAKVELSKTQKFINSKHS